MTMRFQSQIGSGMGLVVKSLKMVLMVVLG